MRHGLRSTLYQMHECVGAFAQEVREDRAAGDPVQTSSGFQFSCGTLGTAYVVGISREVIERSL